MALGRGRAIRGARATGLLLAAGAIDELCSAAPAVTAPAVTADLGLSYGALGAFTLALPLVVSLAVEPAAMWLADGRWRRALLVGSAILWAVGNGLAALAPSGPALAAALAIAFPAAGVTLGVAEVALLSEADDPEPVLTRWTLAGALGDLAGPLAYAALLAAGGDWRHGFTACAALIGGYAVVCGVVPLGRGGDDDDDERWPGLRAALSDPVLLAWLLGAAGCTLLDEILVSFAALYQTAALSTSEDAASLGIAALMTGSVVGLTAVERQLVRGSLVGACAVSLVGLGLLLGGAISPAVALFVTGLGVGPQWPLALARAHRRLPDRPGLVSAIGQLFTPVELLAPIAVGLCADRLGLGWALGLLAVQPLLLLALSVRFRTR